MNKINGNKNNEKKKKLMPAEFSGEVIQANRVSFSYNALHYTTRVYSVYISLYIIQLYTKLNFAQFITYFLLS